jgi:ketol-acid reductoisomerase
VCLKCPGSEVREEYKEVLSTTLIALHPENDPKNGFEQAKAHAVATGGHKAGVLNLLVAR